MVGWAQQELTESLVNESVGGSHNLDSLGYLAFTNNNGPVNVSHYGQCFYSHAIMVITQGDHMRGDSVYT